MLTETIHAQTKKFVTHIPLGLHLEFILFQSELVCIIRSHHYNTKRDENSLINTGAVPITDFVIYSDQMKIEDPINYSLYVIRDISVHSMKFTCVN